MSTIVVVRRRLLRRVFAAVSSTLYVLSGTIGVLLLRMERGWCGWSNNVSVSLNYYDIKLNLLDLVAGQHSKAVAC